MGYILTEEDFNKYYEEIMNETKDVSYVTHYIHELQHVNDYNIKITPEVTNVLFPNDFGKIGRTFHIGQIDGEKGIDNFRKTVKNRLPVSSFTYLGGNLPDMQGIQTRGGIIYELFGQILFRGNRDIMSVPDNRGSRWLYPGRIFPSSIKSEFYNDVDNFKKSNPEITNFIKNNTQSSGRENARLLSKIPEKYGRYIATYRGICMYYIKKYTSEIKSHITSEETSGWDEILIQNYYVNDVIWTTQNISAIGEYSWVSDFNRLVAKDVLNADEKMLFKELHGKYRKIIEKIESFMSEDGIVTYTADKRLAMNWVKEHGGFHKRDDFEKHIRSGSEVSEISDYLYKEQKEMKKKIKITEEQLKRLMELKQLDERRHTYIEPKEEVSEEEEMEENDDMSVAPPEEVDEKKDLPTPPSEEEEKNNQVYESIKKEFKRFL